MIWDCPAAARAWEGGAGGGGGSAHNTLQDSFAPAQHKTAVKALS